MELTKQGEEKGVASRRIDDYSVCASHFSVGT